ncbi:MAG TPA: glycosyl hydrolase, partial [Dyella sp.]
MTKPKKLLHLAIAAAMVLQAGTVSASNAWSDAHLSPDKRADLLVSQLTLDEKIQLVHSFFAGPPQSNGKPERVPPGAIGSAGYVPA